MPIDRVAIVGAGMAGLTAALAFAQRGIASDIFEQAPEIASVGAGLQISPNASRILAQLGVLDGLEKSWTEPDHIALMSGTSLRQLTHVPAGDFARKRWGSPYGVLHRATLQAVLLDAVGRDPLCTVHLDSRIAKADHATLREITGHSYPLIVGADGVWSDVRMLIEDAPEPDFSGNVAWRFIIPRNVAPDFLRRNAVTTFLGPASHLVCYPLSSVDGFNAVAIGSGVDPGKTWDAETTDQQRKMLIEQFRGWHPAIVKMLETAPRPNFWPLHQVTTGRWQNGRDTVLIGDAAHAMMPFAAQGAAMAIEDAYILAEKVSGALPLPQALAEFEAERVPRIAKVRARGRFNRFAYHARGPIRLGRDIVLSLRPPQSLAADLDWLYGFKAD